MNTVDGSISDEVLFSYAFYLRAGRQKNGGSPIQVPANMTYREWYAKHVTGPGKEWKDKAKRNERRDLQQWQEYRAVLGEHAPKTLEKFQEMEYTDAERWGVLHIAYQDGVLQKRIQSGEYDLTVNPEKQARHMMGDVGYIPGRSAVTVSTEELQALVHRFAGTGAVQRTADGRWKNTEIVGFPSEIGFVVKPDGAQYPTNHAKIHYSKTGVHVVPYKKGE